VDSTVAPSARKKAMPSAAVPPYCYWLKVAITPALEGTGRL
jgi:hypothetical protein